VAADTYAAFLDRQRKTRWIRGLPRFEAKAHAPRIYLSGAGTRFEGDRVRLPKFGWMRWRGGDLPSHRLPGPKRRTTLGLVSGRVWCDAGGRWMLSCVFECGPLPLSAPVAAVAEMRQDGESIVTRLDGRSLDSVWTESDKRLEDDRRRLRRLQRRLSRCQDGSKRKAVLWERYRTVARRIRNRERDRNHKLTTTVVRAAGVIIVEQVRGEVLRQLDYKAEWHGRSLRYGEARRNLERQS